MLTERERQIIEKQSPQVLKALIASMAEHIEKQKELITQLKNEKAAKDQMTFVMEERVKLLRRQLYGKSSEIREASDRPRDKSQEKARLFSQAAFPSPETKQNQKNQSKGRDLPERIVDHHPSSEELAEESALRGLDNPSDRQWMETGLYDECTKIQIIERSYIKEVHRKHKYKLRPEFNQSEKEVLITSKGPSELLPGMNYTTEFVSSVVADKFEDYSGPVMTDGYKSYDSVLAELKVPRAYCWSHARREFLPLESHDPTVKPILDLIDKLFEVERRAKSFEELRSLRDQESSRLANELKPLLQAELGNSRLGSQKRKAIEYSLSRWQGLTLFLKDTRVPMSNNEAERTIRHSVVGRKNFYGSGSHSGAATAATLYTIVESCKKNDLDPRTFILMSLQRAAQGAELETPLAFARRTRSSQDAD